jgi:hypothetical protein
MFVTELDTFVQKFQQLWNAGLTAHLDLDTRDGYAWVSLHLQLGHVPGPLHPQPVHVPGGARLRRKQKRSAARKQAEEAAKTADKAVKSGKAEEAPKKVTIDIIDEFCDDKAYDSNVETSLMKNENLIKEVCVTPEGEIPFDEETLEKKLDGVGIKAIQIETKKSKALVKIDPTSKEKIYEAMFPLRVSGLKMDFIPG